MRVELKQRVVFPKKTVLVIESKGRATCYCLFSRLRFNSTEIRTRQAVSIFIAYTYGKIPFCFFLDIDR